MKKNKKTSIFHLAASLSVGESQKNPKKYIKNNIVGTKNLVKIAIKYKKTPSPQAISRTLLLLGILKINFSNGHIHGLAHEKNFLNPNENLNSFIILFLLNTLFNLSSK